MKPRIWKLIFLVVLFPSIDTRAQGESSKLPDGAAVSPRAITINQAIDLGAGFKLMPVVKKHTHHECDIRATIPQFEAPLTAAMGHFNALVQKQLDESIEAWDHGACPNHDYFQRNYRVSHADRRIVSILFNDSFIAGGPSPAQDESVVNYDLAADKILLLEDIFKPGSDYLKLIADYALFKIAGDEALAGKHCEQARGITLPVDANYRNWLLNVDGLAVHFEHTGSFPFQPYSEEVLVEVPFSVLKDAVRAGSTVAYLIPSGTKEALHAVKAREYEAIEDGQYYAFIKQISFCNVSEGEIIFDIVELLTGDAAIKAAREDGEIRRDEVLVDSDYYIRNQNPRLRTLPISENPQLKVLNINGELWMFAGNYSAPGSL